MNEVGVIFFGFLQAVTEFLPISSSGHLLILHEVWQINFSQKVIFDLALHLGTLLAVIGYFRKDVWRYLKTTWCFFFQKEKINKHSSQELSMLFGATIPAIFVGLFFGERIEDKSRNIIVVLIMLVFVALLFLYFSSKKRKDGHEFFANLTFKRAFLIGVAQTLAFIPGVSRSGITIIAGLSFNLKKIEAARFSFLLSIPTILGAVLLKFGKFNWGVLTYQDWNILILGVLSSLLFGLLVIKYFLKILQKYSLKPFAYYRIILALGVLLFLFIK